MQRLGENLVVEYYVLMLERSEVKINILGCHMCLLVYLA